MIRKTHKKHQERVPSERNKQTSLPCEKSGDRFVEHQPSDSDSDCIDYKPSKKSMKVKTFHEDDNGNMLEGEITNGKLHGEGKMTLKSGEVLEGRFVKNKLFGKGIRTLPDGTVMVGQFADNELNGKGKITSKNGDYRKGDFENSVLSGKGKTKTVLTTDANSQGKTTKLEYQDGTFVAGCLSGQGSVRQVLLYDRGNDISDHTEKHYWETPIFPINKAQQYRCCLLEQSGEFRNGKLNGNGYMKRLNGEEEETMEGQFVDGLLEGKGRHIIFEYGHNGGSYSYFKANNSGINACHAKSLIKNDASHVNFVGFTPAVTMTGEFKGGKLEGKGVMFYPDCRCEGIFANGLLTGLGKSNFGFVEFDGKWLNGCFKNGRVEILDSDWNKREFPSMTRSGTHKKSPSFHGVKDLKNGTVFKGSFSHWTTLTGEGLVIIPGVGTYEGGFSEGKPNEDAVFTPQVKPVKPKSTANN